jgi:hypothetical protein
MAAYLLDRLVFCVERSEMKNELPPELVEKGETMEYSAPVIEVAGPARELVQASMGPRSDGDGYQFSQGGFVCSPEE